MPGQPQSQARPGSLVFAAAFVVFSVFLITQLGAETKYSASGKLFSQPAFWPAVGVTGMLLFGVLHFAGEWAGSRSSAVTTEPTLVPGLRELGFWVRALEYLLWFMVYVWIAPLTGYLPATLLFTTLLTLRAGYRKPVMLLYAAATGLGIVLVFKTLLAVKIPGGALYEHLPATARNFMIIYF